MFFTYDFQPEVDTDVISGTAVDNVGVDVPVKLLDYRSNGFRYIRVADYLAKPVTIARFAEKKLKHYSVAGKMTKKTQNV